MKRIVTALAFLLGIAQLPFVSSVWAQQPYGYAPGVVSNEEISGLGGGINEFVQCMTLFDPSSDPALARMKGKKVLVVEDGPTLTHGEMKIGAGTVAAVKYGAELVDPRPYTVGELKTTFERYPNIGTLLPAMGYGEKQVRDLEKTIAKTPCDAVVIGTPIDLQRFVKIKQPCVKVGYELQEIGTPTLKDVLDEFVKKHKLAPKACKKNCKK